MKRVVRAWFVVTALAVLPAAATRVQAQPAAEQGSALVPERTARQGVAVIALGADAHDDAFALARAVYGSRLRPAALDEVRARVLAGSPPPPNASRELRELAEIRASVTGDDAAGRRLLASVAQQLAVEALLVVKVEAAAEAPPRAASETTSADAGARSQNVGNAERSSRVVVARLFLAEPADFDAARYSPDAPPEPDASDSPTPTPAAWKSTVTSLEGRFPAPSRTAAPAATRPAPPAVRQEPGKSSPFYTSGWFWGAVGGAALLGAAFYFASQDTSSDTIHLQMHVPR